MALLSSKVTTFYGIFIGPILLKATERPKQTDWGATTKPSLQWNLPQAMVAMCHCLHPNTPYMQQMQMRRTRVWSSLTSVPQYIYLSRYCLSFPHHSQASHSFPSIPILGLSDLDLFIICLQDCLIESNRNWKACQARRSSYSRYIF
jgi:hypothetical protein